MKRIAPHQDLVGAAAPRDIAAAGARTIRRGPLLALAGIVVLAAVLRMHGLIDRPIWADEAFHWRLVGFPWPEMLRRAAQDTHPALYPLLLKAWSAVFGTSTAALRSLSVVCGTATVVGAYLFTLEAFDTGERELRGSRRTGAALLAAALVAVSVFQVRWSWDIKMMALGAMLSVYSSWALLRALRVATMRAWLGYAGLALAFLHTHYYALFSVFAQWAFTAAVLWRNSRLGHTQVQCAHSWRRLVLCITVVCIGMLPWLPTFVRQHNRDRMAGLRRAVTAQRLIKTPFSLFIEPEPEDANTTDQRALILPSAGRSGNFRGVFGGRGSPGSLAVRIG